MEEIFAPGEEEKLAGAATAEELTPYVDALRVPPVLRPVPTTDPRGTQVEIELTETWTRLHSQLPPTRVWAYNGHFPGPTFEVRRGQRIRVAWTNRLTGTFPVTSVAVKRGDPADPNTNHPGRDGVKPDPNVAALPGWIVTHLHGAETGGGNDGWAENAVANGDAQLSEYPNNHQATQWWYHDHAMNITRWNVYAGLVGTYLIRDAEEDALRLPRGKYEVPLVLADRNLDVDDDAGAGTGRLNGQLLHKVISLGPNPESGKDITLPFSGPYSTVNGTIWPHLEVEPRWYRFRLVNASNARVYNLALVDEKGVPVPPGTVKQIGSDGGLLPRPVDITFADDPDPARRKVLPAAPAERFDLLIDFRALRGKKLRLVNVGTKGFGTPDPAAGVAYPQVMEFRVDKEPVREPFVLPATLSGTFQRLGHDIPHNHRLILLTPPGTVGGGGHPEIWEMTDVTEEVGDGPLTQAEGIVQLRGRDGVLRTYRRIARTFDDTLGFKVAHNDVEQWSFLNLGGPTHPMHIHLADFQLTARDAYDASGFDPAIGGTRDGSPVVFQPDRPIPIAPNETGWKDTYQVPAGQMVTVLGRFDGAHGRFMYHCHLLEHEDMGMMRPFTVMPPEVLKFDHGHGGHPHGA
ncbi:multicopper oxidase domain-containing protein [Streptomyces iconiensis]|uniref:Multicopper oxidase domain-containing protein n=1 Tax=Streptomyces iconiensis TaxID=1384038 RepID=A0ABT7A3I8_9ACTN|nr:O-aminophenol oxidase PhsA [Streptomyces iconiensis]MDJ1135892.1 multicopper oxidase domain-containing protein [Streptomyces iconiensis]